MIWIIDQILAFLTDLRSAPLLSQILTIAGIPGVAIGLPVWMMTRKVRASVTGYETLEQSLSTARQEAKQLETDNAALVAQSPETFLAQHAREMKDDNEEIASQLATDFLVPQEDALLLAFRSRMDEAIRLSIDDGASAFAEARRWALAARAIEPDDQMLRMLIDELAAAEAISASDVRVKLKSDMDREERAAKEDRLPADIVAMTRAFFSARSNGHYALMLFLAGHGLTLTRRRPFGEGSKEHLLFRRHRVEALYYVGRFKDCLSEAIPLRLDFNNIFGKSDRETFYIRHLIALCQKNSGDIVGALVELDELFLLETEIEEADHPSLLPTRILIAQCWLDLGDAAGALEEFEKLLLIQIDALGSKQSDVFSIRFSIAQCRLDLGGEVEALAELEELLPLQIVVEGAEHPHVILTRYTIAYCRKDMGDAASALAELEEVLPLYSDVLGVGHPYVLLTRHLMAQCRQDTGDTAGALAELEELLPLQADSEGAENTSVLSTRITRAACLLDQNNREAAAEEIEGIREGLVAVKLRSEHRSFRRLDEVENRLRSNDSH